MSLEGLFASGIINILGVSPVIQLNYKSGGVTIIFIICPEGSPSFIHVISLEGVTVIVILMGMWVTQFLS